MKRMEKRVTVGIPQELYELLKRLAEQDSRSLPSYIRQVLWKHIGR